MEIINSQILADWVKEERNRQGMKQNALAERASLSPQAVCSLEKGRRTPTLDTMIAVADSLGYRLVLEKVDTCENCKWFEGGRCNKKNKVTAPFYGSNVSEKCWCAEHEV